jgi:D-alanyl-D-alanine carboxypeptidase/D-alanyl-D-alanine-endopeptidase (penicillin-binding protein 4)
MPASIHQSQKVFNRYLETKFSWRNTHIEEGAGLSRNNRICASQLVALLERFRPYAYLLPTLPNGIVGKTGSLNGISSLAGYLSKNVASPAFALLLNDAQLANSRQQLLDQIKQRWDAIN